MHQNTWTCKKWHLSKDLLQKITGATRCKNVRKFWLWCETNNTHLFCEKSNGKLNQLDCQEKKMKHLRFLFTITNDEISAIFWSTVVLQRRFRKSRKTVENFQQFRFTVDVEVLESLPFIDIELNYIEVDWLSFWSIPKSLRWISKVPASKCCRIGQRMQNDGHLKKKPEYCIFCPISTGMWWDR